MRCRARRVLQREGHDLAVRAKLRRRKLKCTAVLLQRQARNLRMHLFLKHFPALAFSLELVLELALLLL